MMSLQISVDSLDFWIFEIASEDRIPTCCLAVPNFEELFNRGKPDVSLVETLDYLWQHYQQGLFAFFLGGNPVNPSYSEIRSAMAPLSIRERIGSLYYGLTGEGGRVWEKIAHPRWSDFLLCESWTEDNHDLLMFDIFSAQEEKAIHFYEKICSLPELGLLEQRTRMERLANWHPTYWKKLPSGFHISFSATNTSMISDPRMPNTPSWH